MEYGAVRRRGQEKTEPFSLVLNAASKLLSLVENEKSTESAMDTDTEIRKPAEPRSPKFAAIERAAYELFLQHGYGNVTMDEIARRAGVSKATIYAHFADKAELFAGIMRTDCSMTWVKGELEGRPVDDVRACLIDLGHSYMGVLTEKGAMSRMVIAESQRFPELAEIFFEHGPNASRRALARYLERACAAGKLAIADTDRAANQFYALLRDDTYLRGLLGLPIAGGQAELDAVVEAAVDLFLKGYAAP
jgi:AcrR family transcriptional regulator